MRSLSIQVQPALSPEIDMVQIDAAFNMLVENKTLVTHHDFNQGEDNGLYFNFTFGTPDVKKLWPLIQRDFFADNSLGIHMLRASIVVCTGDDGWNDYLLLHHFDGAQKLDAL